MWYYKNMYNSASSDEEWILNGTKYYKPCKHPDNERLYKTHHVAGEEDATHVMFHTESIMSLILHKNGAFSYRKGVLRMWVVSAQAGLCLYTVSYTHLDVYKRQIRMYIKI